MIVLDTDRDPPFSDATIAEISIAKRRGGLFSCEYTTYTEHVPILGASDKENKSAKVHKRFLSELMKSRDFSGRKNNVSTPGPLSPEELERIRLTIIGSLANMDCIDGHEASGCQLNCVTRSEHYCKWLRRQSKLTGYSLSLSDSVHFL